LITELLSHLILCVYDLSNHRDFHDRYVIDEGDLNNSIMGNQNVYTKRRTLSSIGTNAILNVKLELSNKILYRKQGNETIRQYIISAKVGNEKISKIQKTYQQIKSFNSSLEYSLRSSGFESPKLEEELHSDAYLGALDDILL